ncbi:hypothetical protein TNCV_1704581 [Trichonephila clavipes]|nr:hypothetical protein TNCV_1704581 [Trichonephila clavipes]
MDFDGDAPVRGNTNGIIRKHRRQSAILSQYRTRHKEIKEAHFDLFPFSIPPSLFAFSTRRLIRAQTNCIGEKSGDRTKVESVEKAQKGAIERRAMCIQVLSCSNISPGIRVKGRAALRRVESPRRTIVQLGCRRLQSKKVIWLSNEMVPYTITSDCRAV